MHQSGIQCAWNPIYTDLIATGSGDVSTNMAMRRRSRVGERQAVTSRNRPRDKKNKDVNDVGMVVGRNVLLATGSYDGVARIWARNGGTRLIHR
jgi:transducin (beta)-like 1